MTNIENTSIDQVIDTVVNKKKQDKNDAGVFGMFDFMKMDENEIKAYLLSDMTNQEGGKDILGDQIAKFQNFLPGLIGKVKATFDPEIQKLKAFLEENQNSGLMLGQFKQQVESQKKLNIALAIQQATSSFTQDIQSEVSYSSNEYTGLYNHEQYIQNVLNDAESQIGKPYVWGGASTRGFDCSGLWNWAFKKQGITFNNRFNAALFSKTDANLSKDQVKKGDFMYWDKKPGTKKHNPIYHIEMVVEQPFLKNGNWYVKTIGSSTDKGILSDQGKPTRKSGVGYRLRKVNSYRHFGRPPYYLQLAEYNKTQNKENLFASNKILSDEYKQKLVA